MYSRAVEVAVSLTRIPIRFVAGSRQLLSVSRDMQTCMFTLDNLVDGAAFVWPEPREEADGIRFSSVPFAMLDQVHTHYPSYVMTGLQRYARHYIAMSGFSYAEYLAKFSSRTRSSLNRKRRHLADAMGGDVRIAEFRDESDVERFVADAAPVSHRSYQGRLLGVGLPEDPAAVHAMKLLARRGEMRAYVLYGKGQPLSYLYLPTTHGVIVYAYLGYDPAAGSLSVGTVLQLEALERLFAENRYRYFDFGEGTGQHKDMFATHSVDACSFFYLKPTVANYALATTLGLFNHSVKGARWLAEHSAVLPQIRRILRR